ncbi:MAG: nucleotidyl transferase AbiEii/AbiGii toxin family protein [Oscillospiraceae bacterium]|nr:nucleotidyl transferase AbiEii/AbiGii toxin family protein [Oscillospiraceae bacterium]
MDASLKSIPLGRDTVLSIFEEILSIDTEDNITYEILAIKDIREQDEYGGYQINILGTLENITINMFVEISSGDVITPKEIEFNYKCIFTDKTIPIFAYTIETIIAEKFETFIIRSIDNTRLKDYYDLYLLISDNFDKINRDTLQKAIKNTFTKRGTSLDTDFVTQHFEAIKSHATMQELWSKYVDKNKFVRDVKYNNIMEAIEEIINLCPFEN